MVGLYGLGLIINKKKAVQLPKLIRQTNQIIMKKFYKITIGVSTRYYTNLTKLCEQEQLNYVNIYHSVTRLKKGFWSDGNCTVEKLCFSGV